MDSEERERLKFSGGELQVRSIRDKLETIGMCFLNLSLYDPVHEAFNYEVVFNTLNFLRQEIHNDLSEPDKRESLIYKKIYEDFIKIHPVHKMVKNETKRPIWTPKFFPKNLFFIKKILYTYETAIRKYLDQAGINPKQKKHGRIQFE